MTNISEKSAEVYWKNKLKGKNKINPKSFIDGIQTSQEIISFDHLHYFFKLTNNQEILEQTVFTCSIILILKRYSYLNNFIYTSINDKSLLIHSEPIGNFTFKEYLNVTKKEIQESFSNSNYNKEFQQKIKFNRYANYCLVYNDEKANLKSFPFAVSIKKENHQFIFDVHFYNSFIEKSIVNQFLITLRNWLINLENYLHESVQKIDIITTNDRNKLLNDFNRTSIGYPKDKTIIDLFEEQVDKTPESIAIIFEDKKLTYKQLSEKSNQFGLYLLEKFNISPNDLIGVKLERNENLIVTILGILKAGGAYVPIDVNYPKERITYIEKDSNCKVIIDSEELELYKLNKEKYRSNHIPKLTTPNNTAYVIYTSGTTGKPKGVEILNKNAVALLNWAWKEYDLKSFDIVYATTSQCFDLSIYEMFYPLSIGKKIRLLENSLEINKYLETDSKVLINTVPSSVRNFLNNKPNLENISVINLAGESFPVDIANELIKYNVEVRNLYGPSEDTTYSTCYKLINKKIYSSSVPIGKPISNTFCYILDDNLELLPIGVPGKLYVSGAGVSKGYLNRPNLTSDRFINNPFVTGERMYDTGDVAKWLPDGNIEFLGRKDNQVKIRGFRIELEEIENKIIQFSKDIRQAVLNVTEREKNKELVAYYVTNNAIDNIELKKYLKDQLPSYMVPNHFKAIEQIPLTANGKIDKKSLPEVTGQVLIDRNYVAPRNKEEKILANIWQEVLGVDQIGITENFFELGGHSLQLSQIINRIYQRLNKSITYKGFFENPTIASISTTFGIEVYKEISKAEIKPSYPLTPSQQRIWVLSQLDGANLAYNMSGAVTLKGDLDKEKFEKAFNMLISRHEILRTNFKETSHGEVVQSIQSFTAKAFTLDYQEVCNSSSLTVDELLRKSNTVMFDLSEDILLRGLLLKTKKKEYIFSLTMHHIIGDGWSIELLISELITIYNGLKTGSLNNLPNLKIQYKDYAVWLSKQLEEEAYKNSEAYWLSQFQDTLPVLELPSFKSRPKILQYRGKTISHKFSPSFLELLKEFSVTNNASLFMTLMSGVNSLLCRYTNQEDIILGTPIAGREHPDLEGQIGLYLNTLAIRTNIDKSDSFSTILKRQKEILVTAYEHQQYPFDELVNKLNLTRDTSRSPLFDVLVVLQNQSQVKSLHLDGTLSGIVVEDYPLSRNTSQFDISFTFIEKERHLNLEIEYNTTIYDDFLMTRMFTHYENLVSQLIENSSAALNSIDYLHVGERQLLLQQFNDTTVVYPKDKTIIDLFEEQVKRTPDNIALVFENQKLNYKELNQKSNQLANYLQDEYTVKSNDLIGIKLKRSEYLIISILAILKSGAAYVPIDINYPEERIKYIEKDSNCKLILDQNILNDFKKNKGSYNNFNLKQIADPKKLAYVIYTSGTTGNPKGVLIKNSNLYDYALTFKNYFEVKTTDSLLQQASISFDTSVEEIFPILISGGKLVLVKDHNDFDILFKKCEAEAITILSTNPFALEYFNQNKSNYPLLSFRTLISGGDKLSFEYVSNLYLDFEVYNTYGPTESTVCSTYYKIESELQTIPIGTPIANREVFVINDHNILQPVGVAGELCISGLGLASGYLNKDEITDKKFIANPFKEGTRMYKSGDLVKWLPNGNLEFLGRNDHQVKLRGHRIELEEIENIIFQFSKSIQQVVVCVKEFKRNKELVVYYVAKSTVQKEQLRSFIEAKLPSYMIPSFYIELATIPLTSNGKIDRKSLPAISREDGIRYEYIAPETETEKKLVTIWEEILGLANIGITDNFFELGGHSLKITQLKNHINKVFSITIPFKDLFTEVTIKGQSKLIEKATKSNKIIIPKLPKQDNYTVSSSQRRIWMLSQFEGGNSVYNMPGVFVLTGDVNVTILEKAFKSLIERHEVLRTRFKEDEFSGEIKQIVHSSEENSFILQYEENSFLNASKNDLNTLIESEKAYNFDLSNESLLKTKIVKISKQKYLLIFIIHHIICDGWSVEILKNELFMFYNSLLKKEKNPLKPLTIHYKEYGAWEQSQWNLETFKISQLYWQNQFKDQVPVLELPTKKRPRYRTYEGAVLQSNISKEILAKFKQVCRSNEGTLFMGLVSIVNFLLYKYSNQNDIVIGTPIAGREHILLQNQLGVFINTLPLRTHFQANESFEKLFEKVKATTLGAYEHQKYPFDKLVSELPLQRDSSRNPLFDVMVTLQNTEQNSFENASAIGFDIEEYVDNKTVKSKFDLDIVFVEKEEGLEVDIVFNTSLFTADFIQKLQHYLTSSLTLCIDNWQTPLYKIPFLTSKDSHELIEEFNDTFFDYGQETSFLSYFKEQVQQQPNGIAVLDETQKYTYQELDKLTTQVAIFIRDNFKGERDPLGVMLDRSATTIALLLGILKSGRAYIPLDPTFPIDRLQYIIEHSEIKVLITSEEISEVKTEAVTVLNITDVLSGSSHIETDLEYKVQGEDTAYIIYTSGSTGNPKGVEISHQSLLNFLISIQRNPGINRKDILFAVTTYSFDISILEFFTPLIAGGSVFIVSNETLSEPDKIINLLSEVKPTIIQGTPSFYQQLFNAGWTGSKTLKVLCGGDTLSESLASKLLSTTSSLWNMYGPTETTIWSTVKKITTPEEAGVIGTPIANTSIYILDDFLQLQPKKVIGNLFIGGEGLAKGYYKQPELTQEKFIKNPYGEGLIYNTGDVAKWNDRNELVFLGRNDNQVKIRGYRIELGDIEAKMNLLPGIKKAIVVAKKDVGDDSILVAYYLSKEKIDTTALRFQLKETLPYYMIPTQFVQLEDFPLTPNKKINRKVLIQRDDTQKRSSINYIAPSTSTEKKIALIWTEVLAVEKTGLEDDFFNLGGHSLSVTKLVSAIQKELSVKLSINEIFEHPTLESQVTLIENKQLFLKNNTPENTETEFENFTI